MEAAGCNGDDIANKYKEQGLRVIAIDVDGGSYGGSEQKWRAAGANFPLYKKDNCSFEEAKTSDDKSCLRVEEFPTNRAVQKWVVSQIRDYSESGIRGVFDFKKP